MHIIGYNKIVCLLVLFFLSGVQLQAQSTLTGTVIDQKSKAPVPFANVYVENTFTGVATGDDGGFTLEVKEGHQGKVIVRAIGYETRSIPQSDFSQQALKIYLSPVSFDIKEVEKSERIALKDPVKIIKKAIKSIPENMAADYTILEGTYHQVFQDYETDSLLDASQVEVKVGLAGIETKHKADSLWHTKPLSDHVFWQKFRYNDDALLPQYQIPDYGTNHLQFLLRMDPVRNYKTPTFDFVDRLDKDFISNHYFMLDTIGVYNNENVYHIRIYLLNNIRFSKVNVLTGDFDFREIEKLTSPRSGKEYSIYPNYTYLLKQGHNEDAIPIGRMMISTKDFAIVYFEYINGFGNDRYKFIAEYIKNKGKYYPSKLYFANKFIMSKHPDFNATGADIEYGLKCLMSEKYYDEIVENYSKTKNSQSIVNGIINEYTIDCHWSGYAINEVIVVIDTVAACTRIVEEVQNTFQYSDFQKCLHHRYVDFKIPDSNSTASKKSDFNEFYYPLGARNFHWNAYRLRKGRYNAGFTYTIYTGKGNGPYSPVIVHYFVPIPFTSTDEYRYIFAAPRDTFFYNKNFLIKGRVGIEPD